MASEPVNLRRDTELLYKAGKKHQKMLGQADLNSRHLNRGTRIKRDRIRRILNTVAASSLFHIALLYPEQKRGAKDFLTMVEGTKHNHLPNSQNI